MQGPERIIQNLLDRADTGVRLNGPNPWDPQVHNGRFYGRIIREGALGFGESYMDGWWACRDPDAMPELFSRLVGSKMNMVIAKQPVVALQLAGYRLSGHLTNRQTIKRSKKVGRIHYDDDLFAQTIYDARMTGSCAYWKNASNLDEAQEAKLDLICRKLGVRPGDRLFDIGCGWGSLMGYAHEKYGVISTGVTISHGQAAYARKRYAETPLKFLVQDYREFKPTRLFDFVSSVGMFEHVGSKNYGAYFDFARRILKPGGLFLLHTITGGTSSMTTDPFIDKYIFPGGQLPTEAMVLEAIQGKFVVEDMHNIGANYDPTLCAWLANLRANRAEMVAEQGERAVRMYEYYLASCAGGFRCRGINVQQFVLSPHGVNGGYTSVR